MSKPPRTFYDFGHRASTVVTFITACVLACAAYAAWALPFGVRALDYALIDARALALIPIFIGVVISHETVHAAVLGVLFDPSKGRLVWHRGMLSVDAYGMGPRGEYVTSLLAPLLIISGAIPALGLLLLPDLAWLFAAAATLNAFFSARDVHIAWSVLTKTPRGALVGGAGDYLGWQE